MSYGPTMLINKNAIKVIYKAESKVFSVFVTQENTKLIFQGFHFLVSLPSITHFLLHISFRDTTTINMIYSPIYQEGKTL